MFYSWIILNFIIILISSILNDYRYATTFFTMSSSIGILFLVSNIIINKTTSLRNKLTEEVSKLSITLKVFLISVIKLTLIGVLFFLSIENDTVLSWEITLILIAISPVVAFFFIKKTGDYES